MWEVITKDLAAFDRKAFLVESIRCLLNAPERAYVLNVSSVAPGIMLHKVIRTRQEVRNRLIGHFSISING